VGELVTRAILQLWDACNEEAGIENKREDAVDLMTALATSRSFARTILKNERHLHQTVAAARRALDEGESGEDADDDWRPERDWTLESV
jgi:hypothetical protein